MLAFQEEKYSQTTSLQACHVGNQRQWLHIDVISYCPMNARIITIREDGRTTVWCDFNIEKETPKRRMSFGSVAVFGGICILGIGYIAAPRVVLNFGQFRNYICYHTLITSLMRNVYLRRQKCAGASGPKVDQ